MKEKVLSRIAKDPKTGCWNWVAYLDRNGYGRIGITHRKYVYAHRLSYEAFVGDIPDGLHIDHLCRNPACVNPEHLEPVTNKENHRRGKHGVLFTHCKHGHEMNEENTWLYKERRYCRECSRRRKRDSWRRKHWGVASCLCLVFIACSAKTPLRPSESRILNPFTVGCRCTSLPDIELGHFMLVGDKVMQDKNEALRQCIEAGLLAAEEEVKDPLR